LTTYSLFEDASYLRCIKEIWYHSCAVVCECFIPWWMH